MIKDKDSKTMKEQGSKGIELLSDEYEVVESKGKGAFGEVFYCIDKRKIQADHKCEEECKVAIKKIFLEKTRKEWCDLMEGTDICFAPVLNMTEAPKHPHNVERKTFIDVEGVTQPAPAPRFSRTKAEVISSPALVGEHSEEILKDLGLSEEEIASLRSSGGIA